MAQVSRFVWGYYEWDTPYSSDGYEYFLDVWFWYEYEQWYPRGFSGGEVLVVVCRRSSSSSSSSSSSRVVCRSSPVGTKKIHMAGHYLSFTDWSELWRRHWDF